MTPIRHARLIAQTGRGLAFDLGGGRSCMVSLLGPALVRVLHLADGAPRLDRSWTVAAPDTDDVPWAGRDRLDETAWPIVAYEMIQQPNSILLQTDLLHLSIDLEPFALRWCLPDGRVFAADRPLGHEFARHGSRIAHHMTRHAQDRYYGLGDKTGALDLHGRRLRCMALDSLGYDPARGDPLYKHWPFLITQDGATGTAYGTYYDNGAVAAFDLGCAHDNYHGLFRSYEAHSGDLDFYLFLGPRLRDVTPAFLRLTGRTALPPRWSLGYAQTAMALADEPEAQTAIEAFIDRVAAERIPISSFHFGSGYTTIGTKRYVFTWNDRKFPDPAALMARFHAAGMRVVANLKPCLLDDHPRYAEIGALAIQGEDGPEMTQFWDGEGAHLDFTNPAAIAWWQDGVARSVLSTGIDAGWNDNNEFALWGDSARCHGFGRPIALELVRAVQALLMTRATIERQRAITPAERQFTVTRGGCPGVQRYAQSWSGDNTTSWETLRWNLRTGLQMSLSGMYNVGHDIGGFAGPVPSAELLIRWTQTGVVHPRFIMNSWKPDGIYNSPWLHPDATDAIRAAIALRYRLIPYLYSLMHAASERGEPVIQPTFLAFDTDPACYTDCDELMLGPFLLAAPVVRAGMVERPVYLPLGPGDWYDFHDGTCYPSGATVTLPAPLDRLPLLACAGAIIPMTAADGVLLHDEPSRHLCIFPGRGHGQSRFVLHEDDGITADGPRTSVTLTLRWSPDRITLRAEAAGDFALPYDRMSIALPDGDLRPLQLEGALRRDGPARSALMEHRPAETS